MIKSELKKIIEDIINANKSEPTISSGGGYVAPIRFSIFKSFPQIENCLLELMGDDYYLFIDRIEYAAPKPSTFRVVFKNNDNFYLMYSGGDHFIARASGSKYNLSSIGEKERCIKTLNNIIIRGSLSIEKDNLRIGQNVISAEQNEYSKETASGGEEAPPEKDTEETPK